LPSREKASAREPSPEAALVSAPSSGLSPEGAAAIGAVAGAGAGAAGGTFTANKEIVLPAESVLSFKLEQPLELK